MKLLCGEWIVEILDEEPHRVFLSSTSKPGAIHINRAEEGYIVDVWPNEGTEVAASCAVEFNELEGEKDE
jgi:hypothetical protein